MGIFSEMIQEKKTAVIICVFALGFAAGFCEGRLMHSGGATLPQAPPVADPQPIRVTLKRSGVLEVEIGKSVLYANPRKGSHYYSCSN